MELLQAGSWVLLTCPQWISSTFLLFASTKYSLPLLNECLLKTPSCTRLVSSSSLRLPHHCFLLRTSYLIQTPGFCFCFYQTPGFESSDNIQFSGRKMAELTQQFEWKEDWKHCRKCNCFPRRLQRKKFSFPFSLQGCLFSVGSVPEWARGVCMCVREREIYKKESQCLLLSTGDPGEFAGPNPSVGAEWK